MERTWLPEAETRLTLLYCLRALGPVTGEQLERYLLTNGLVNYFDLRLNLSALVDLGQIDRQEHPAGVLLVPTPAGIRALDSFTGRIPASRREGIDCSAPEWQARFQREQETPAGLLRRESGTQMLHLQLLEDGRTLAELTLPWEGACPREQWHRAAPGIWRLLLERLTPEDGDTGPGTVPARLTHGDFTLILDPGSEDLAGRAGRRWPKEAEALELEIRRRLAEA